MYYLYDYYEGKELIGKFDNWHDMNKAKRQWIEDTDGECSLEVVFREEEEEIEDKYTYEDLGMGWY